MQTGVKDSAILVLLRSEIAFVSVTVFIKLLLKGSDFQTLLSSSMEVWVHKTYIPVVIL